MNRRGVSLFPIVILIALIAGGWFAWPYIQGFISGTAKFQAEADLEKIVSQVKRHITIEGRTCENLLELEDKYLPTIREMRDPWGSKYGIVAADGYVFSKGPDRRHSADGADGSWDDDLYGWFIEEETGSDSAETDSEE